MHLPVRVHLIALGLLCAPLVQAQIAFPGHPFGDRAEKYGLPPPPLVVLPEVDVNSLLEEDASNEVAGMKGPYRFGFVHAVDHALETSGLWVTMPNGDRIWRLAFHCPQALAVSLTFSDYRIPSGAKLYVYTPTDMPDIRGAFTAESNPGHTVFGIAPIPGDRIVVEYHVPADIVDTGHLRISEVVHAYRSPYGMAKGFGDSGSCNINVICPEGDPWRDQIRSVALITAGGGSCTGQLLNNCAQDSIPYFLTANHCLGSPVGSWVFTFNWDSPDCSPTQNAPMTQTITGSTLLVNDAGTDVAMLELSSRPPASFNAFYSGWDNSGATPDSTVGIHHPRGDIKKITPDFDPPGQATWGSPPAACWQIFAWDVGTTEPGSSGSGLWDQNGRLIGQLFGGAANCTNSVDDYYGRFDVSWPLLEPWLGMCGNILDGWDQNTTAPVTLDAAVTAIFNLPEQICADSIIAPIATIKNNGTGPLSSVNVDHSFDGGPATTLPWTGTLLPGQTMNFPLGAIPITNGLHEFTVRTRDPNGLIDGNPLNDALSRGTFVAFPAQTVTLEITLDNWGTETTWVLESALGQLLDNGGPYMNGQNGTVKTDTFCLGDGCYRIRLFDMAGDGICCGFGDGSFRVLDGDDIVIAQSDGQFTFEDSVTFCLTATSIPELSRDGVLRAWPNPTAGNITVAWEQGTRPVSIRVLDPLGREVSRSQVSDPSSSTVIDMSVLPDGMYILEATGNWGRTAIRVLRQR